ncbi:hypothetical protein EGH22_10475 [Halomicroarcula sp. F28]|uniref:hypothetical protein n=1 Tax=Haloarcula salinisoli TaxID=2487746 RepID=UPI001C73C842|nr:hypothetical protein [Halomicroarcula salinisoli]MBX0286754.1 hypothetical protein [Halomicroarcula salinisoli]
MATRTKALFTGMVGTVGAAGMLALTVYPFDYGVAESAVLAGAVVLVALYQTVLDDAFAS